MQQDDRRDVGRGNSVETSSRAEGKRSHSNDICLPEVDVAIGLRQGPNSFVIVSHTEADCVAQRRHNLPQHSFHALRHYFCSALVRHGASVEAVRLLAGHSRLEVTQRYVHATASDLRGAISKLFGQ